MGQTSLHGTLEVLHTGRKCLGENMNVWSKLILGTMLAATLGACGWGGEPDAADIATAYSNVAQRNLHESVGHTDLGVVPPPGAEASELRLSAYAGQMEFRYEVNKVKCRDAVGRDPGYACRYDLTVMDAGGYGEVPSTVQNLSGHLYRDSEGWLATRFNGAWLVEELDGE